MDNEHWGKKLASDYKQKTGCRRSIRLPAQGQIRFGGEIDRVTVTMEPSAVCANLQTNGAAFEAWSLALRVWCGVENIELRWQPPSGSSDSGSHHYQRFLYRAERFRSLFPQWFHFEQAGDGAHALGIGPFYVNGPGRRGATESVTNRDPSEPTTREAQLEKHLLTSKNFKEHFGLDKVDRQLPVGLFRESVKQRNRIFPGGKGAIDLVGIGERGLSMFELKAGGNIPAGILSEVIFYTSVIRDASGPKARFQFKQSTGDSSMAVSVSEIKNCKRIEAVLLGERFHPLVGHGRIIGTLNEAVRRQWNVSSEQIPITFRGTVLKGSEAAGYQFTDIGAT
jgi:hypothetical protein